MRQDNEAKIKLGHLERVDLRQVWMKESEDFTPWLADNLQELGQALNIELELEAEEMSVGNFRADIVARDLQTQGWILIENQLERTDHSHLGQALTYAAGLKASTVVWIAYHFTDEHIAALDWLNSITDDGVRFFGVQVELWSIDDVTAPRFNVVSRPNTWVKKGKRYKLDVEATPRRPNRRAFILECLQDDPDMTISAIQARAQALGFTISAAHISTIRKEARVQTPAYISEIRKSFFGNDSPAVNE
jgi:hypothetical protein